MKKRSLLSTIENLIEGKIEEKSGIKPRQIYIDKENSECCDVSGGKGKGGEKRTVEITLPSRVQSQEEVVIGYAIRIH